MTFIGKQVFINNGVHEGKVGKHVGYINSIRDGNLSKIELLDQRVTVKSRYVTLLDDSIVVECKPAKIINNSDIIESYTKDYNSSVGKHGLVTLIFTENGIDYANFVFQGQYVVIPVKNLAPIDYKFTGLV